MSVLCFILGCVLGFLFAVIGVYYKEKTAVQTGEINLLNKIYTVKRKE